MKFRALIIISTYVVFTSCENIILDEDFPYQEKLVIRGIIEEGKPIQNIYVGRTLPISVKYSKQFADLKDAIVGVYANDSLIILEHSQNGLYSSNLIAKRDEMYTLVVQWENKFASAQTSVPSVGKILSKKLLSKDVQNGKAYYVQISVQSYSNEVYGSTWFSIYSNGSIGIESTKFGEVKKRNNNQPNEQITINSDDIPSNLVNISGISFGVRVHVYDSPFYDYYISQSSNQISDAIFGQPNANVRWNIKGDGIGMFIAKRDTVIS